MDNNTLTEYLSQGTENLIKNTLKNTLSNPKESAFLISQMKYQSENAVKRKLSENNGIHIPVFLIASITTECNLHCVGCYARANGICFDEVKRLPLAKKEERQMLTKTDWDKIFSEAESLGISFILLAGGEPLLREDVIEAAVNHKRIIFPVFTNGTILSDKILKIFDEHRNLVPVVSAEGSHDETNLRRGAGTYEKIEASVSVFEKNKILYGVSFTVTKDNFQEVVSDEFLKRIAEKSVRIVFLIEYTAVDAKTKALELTAVERDILDKRLAVLKEKYNSIMF
ncbi:MAG: radical SAM protein, partial [Methanocorpusculum sp.]|nr:radical SAM protein [Methanocorpusculum sp.]